MAKQTIDRQEVRELYDKGLGVVQIADKLGISKGSVSKILKQMGIQVTRVAIEAAPKYVSKQETATDHLLYLTNKARAELEWIETSVPPKNEPDYRAWQDQKLKFAAEMRKLISAMADIGYKLFQANEVNEILKIIDEEIGNESIECQSRIRQRLQRRRDIRFPVEFDRTASRR